MLLHSDRPIRREMTSFAGNGIAKTLGNVWGRFDIRVALWLDDWTIIVGRVTGNCELKTRIKGEKRRDNLTILKEKTKARRGFSSHFYGKFFVLNSRARVAIVGLL